MKGPGIKFYGRRDKIHLAPSVTFSLSHIRSRLLRCNRLLFLVLGESSGGIMENRVVVVVCLEHADRFREWFKIQFGVVSDVFPVDFNVIISYADKYRRARIRERSSGFASILQTYVAVCI